MSINDNTKTPSPREGHSLSEVRYHLPELLAELQVERTVGSFSQEKLHQVEISKLFKNRKKRSGTHSQ